MALERNITPMTKRGPVWAAINLAPQDQAHYSGPRTPAAIRTRKTSRSTATRPPASLVLVDSAQGYYKFGGAALSTNADGFFSIDVENTEGSNTNNFEILDPFGHQYIRTYPVFWIPFGAPGSKLKSSKGTKGHQPILGGFVIRDRRWLRFERRLILEPEKTARPLS